MIILDFIPDDKIIKEDRANDPVKEDGILMTTYFWMKIRFDINGIALSRFDEENPEPDPRYVRMCLLDPAIDGYLTVKELKQGDSIVYEPMEDAGKYSLKRVGDKVYIKWNYSNNEAVADYYELLKAFKDFGDKVRIYLLKEFPGFINHPMFGAWFRGESDTITHR